MLSLLSILMSLPSCRCIQPNRISNYRQNFVDLNIDFTNGFKCSDVPNFAKLNNFNDIRNKFSSKSK